MKRLFFQISLFTVLFLTTPLMAAEVVEDAPLLTLYLPAIMANYTPPVISPDIVSCNDRQWQAKDDGYLYCNIEDDSRSCAYSSREVCRDLQTGGFSDWYLPTEAQLLDLATCSEELSLPENTFWSSTQDDSWPSGSRPHFFAVSLPAGVSPMPDGGEPGEGIPYFNLFHVLCTRDRSADSPAITSTLD